MDVAIDSAGGLTAAFLFFQNLLRHSPGLHSGRPKERVQSLRQFGQVAARHARVKVMLQVVSQFEEQGWDDPAAQRSGLRQRRVAVAVVRQVDREQRVDPAAGDDQDGVHKYGRRPGRQCDAGNGNGQRPGGLGQQPGPLRRPAATAPERPYPQTTDG